MLRRFRRHRLTRASEASPAPPRMSLDEIEAGIAALRGDLVSLGWDLVSLHEGIDRVRAGAAGR
jgi:hypothetical protein